MFIFGTGYPDLLVNSIKLCFMFVRTFFYLNCLLLLSFCRWAQTEIHFEPIRIHTHIPHTRHKEDADMPNNHTETTETIEHLVGGQ